MVKDRNDKTKINNWLEGDTFALQIKNYKYSEYNDKYIILIISEMNRNKWETEDEVFFRAKITNTKKLPKSFDELNLLEYIKTTASVYLSENYKFPKETQLLQPDEFNLIYQYLFGIYITKYNFLSKLIYLGNFNFNLPQNEYIPISKFHGVVHSSHKNFLEKLIVRYEAFNNQKAFLYSLEYQRNLKEKAKKEIEIYRDIEAYIQQTKKDCE